MIRAVIFDAFGTLLKMQAGRHPYRRLIKLGIAQGRRPQADDIRRIMCNPWGLRDTAQAFGIEAPETTMLELEESLKAEVEGIEAYPDALEAVELLMSRGVAIGVCSNLGMPYGEAVRRHFPALNAYTFSYAVGAMKPEQAIYEACCADLAHMPSAILMIGDSFQCDCEGPKAAGIPGYYLDRTCGLGDFPDLMTFAML
ncbi:Phosphoglycolate phosphatase [compost metagenome]